MIDKETAAKIWEILVVECGADDEEFVTYGVAAYFARVDHIEHRFQGWLGFGGKFRTDSRGNRWRVDCYPEDETPERKRMILKANVRLQELEREVKNGKAQP